MVCHYPFNVIYSHYVLAARRVSFGRDGNSTVNMVILSGLMLVCKCWEVALMSRPVVSVLKVSKKFRSNFHNI